MGIPGHLVDCGISAGAGGVFGLVGNVAAKAIGYLEAKHAFFAKQTEWAHESELLKLQLQWGHPETESEPAIVAATFSDQPPSGSTLSYRWVEAVRALVRPVLTVGLAAVLATAFFSVPSNDAARAAVADALIFATTAAIVWWFGDRAPSRKR